MTRDVTKVKYKDHHPKKKVKKGTNHFDLIGTDLQLASATDKLTITMVSVVNGDPTAWTWVVDQPKPADITANLITFKAKLDHNSRSVRPKGGGGNDTGDLTITLDYSESSDLPVACPDVTDVEHEP